jgi:predicted HicB family RNase H-like nuclease
MKRSIIIVDTGKELREHIESEAVSKGISLSKYVRAALKKVSKFKEKPVL